MWRDIKDNYASAWAFALACPFLFLIPPMVEFAQHAAEIHIGMYESIAAARDVADNALRMQFGFAKTLALLLPHYWFTRYILSGRNAAFARKLAMPAIGLWLVLFALQGVQLWWSLFGPSLPGLIGLSGKTGLWTGYGMAFLWGVIGIYFTAWAVAWPLGNARIGPIASARIMAGNFWRTIVILISAVLPLMAVHYAFSFAAMGRPAWLVWAIMAVDAVMVGFMALTMAGGGAVAARTAAGRKGISLLPSTG
ncbi:MAG: hypothetical protein AABZ45_07655 [Pseudomonadota bacterium]